MSTVLRVVHASRSPPRSGSRYDAPPSLAEPVGVRLRRHGQADVLERVEDLRADVLAPVLVAGRHRAADLAVIRPLAVGVDVAEVGVQALDDLARQRRLVTEPDRARDDDDVGGRDELAVDRRKVVAWV